MGEGAVGGSSASASRRPRRHKDVNKDWLKKKWEVAPVRPLAPGRKTYMRGSEARLTQRTGSAKGLREAVQEYEDSKLAPGTRRALNARVAFWERQAAAHQVTPWPLDAQKLNLFGSLLLAGCYRSSAAYFAAIKRKHMKTGGVWTPQMTQEIRDGVRSCSRGQGPGKQSAEVDLDMLAKNVTRIPRQSSKWPVAGQDALLAMGHWLLREIEGGTARLADVAFFEGAGCGRAAWTLPCSKTDLRALGHQRVHGCCCPDASCPTATLRRVAKIAAEMAEQTGKNPKDAPLFPDAQGGFVDKANMVACFQAVGEAIGVRKGITGHAPRVSGAKRMARAGIELWQIQLFARWESSVILRYVREAPLAKSHLLAGRMVANEDVSEVTGNSGDKEFVKRALGIVLNRDVTAGDLPAYVTNRRAHHSRMKAHRPRDSKLAFCGWAWAVAVRQGEADVWESSDADLFPKCSSCQKAAFSA